MGDIGAPRVQPVASPVDTFIQTNAGAQLSQLASSLGVASPALARLSETQLQRERDKNTRAGAQQAREDAQSLAETADKKAWQDAVSKRKVAWHQNPWAEYGYSVESGRLAADTYGSDLIVALGEANLTAETDPTAYRKFVADFRSQWATDRGLDSRDPHFQQAFSTSAQATEHSLEMEWAKGAGRRMEQDILDTHAQRVAEIARVEMGLNAAQIATGMPGDDWVGVIAQRVDQATQAVLATNKRAGSTLNRNIADSIIGLAKQTKNVELLKVLGRIRTPGGSLGDIPAIANAITDARKEIAGEIQFDKGVQRQAEEQHRADTRRTLTTEALQTIFKADDPSTVDIRPFQQALNAAGDAQGALDLIAVRNAVTGQEFTSEEGLVDRLYASIWDEGSNTRVSDIIPHVRARRVSRGDASALIAAIQTRDNVRKMGGDGKNPDQVIYKDPVFQDAYQEIADLYRGAYGALQPDAADKLRGARSDLTNLWFEYRRGVGAQADPVQAKVWLSEQVRRLTTQKYPNAVGPMRNNVAQPSAPGKAGAEMDWRTRPAFTKIDALVRLDSRVKSGTVTAADVSLLRGWGVDATNILEFIKVQREILTSIASSKTLTESK